MKKSVLILSISVYATEVNGFRGAIITAPTAENESGVWKKSTKQLERFAQQVGAPDLNALARHAAAGNLVFDATPVKAGEEWENKQTGEKGQYTKDHVRIENEVIELNPMQAMALTASSQIASQFIKHMMGSTSAPVNTASTELGNKEPELVGNSTNDDLDIKE